MTGGQGERIERRLGAVERSLHGMHARLNRLLATYLQDRRRTEANSRALDGTNGEKGIKTRVAILERATVELINARRRRLAFVLTFLLGMITAIVGALANALLM